MKTITHWKECKEQFPTLNDDQAHHVSKLYESYHKGVSVGGGSTFVSVDPEGVKVVPFVVEQWIEAVVGDAQN